MADNGYKDHGQEHPNMNRRMTNVESTIRLMGWIGAIFGSAVIVALVGLGIEALVRAL